MFVLERAASLLLLLFLSTDIRHSDGYSFPSPIRSSITASIYRPTSAKSSPLLAKVDSSSDERVSLEDAEAATSVSTASSNEEQSDLEDAETTAEDGVDLLFDAVDTDGSGTIDSEEYTRHLSAAGYSEEDIQTSFEEMDVDHNGEISRDEFHQAIESVTKAEADEMEDCPMGYFLNSVDQTYKRLGPIGRVSQKWETRGPFKKAYKKISNLFGVDKKRISKLGVSFVLSYSVISNLNGAMSFSVAWYMSIKRTGLSPLVPGQWKSLLSSYAMIYGAIQVLRPFRVAAAIAMSKLSAEYLEMTQAKLNCSRGVAIGCQYIMGQLMMCVCALAGISVVSVLTGVPIMG